MSEKTEQPTPRRLEDARKKGQIPRSRLLNSAAVTLGAMLGLLTSYEETGAAIKAWTLELLGQNHPLSASKAIRDGAQLVLKGALPILLSAFVAALAVTAATVGLQWNFGELGVKLERISPIAGFNRIFSFKIFLELLKAAIVTFVILWLFWDTMQEEARGAFRAIAIDGQQALSLLMPKVLNWLFVACAVLLVLGVADFFWEKWRHLKELMMTKEEVKREYKESEGDPQHKAHRQQLHRQLAASGPARGVHKATAIVANPTHISIALRYDPAEVDAPYLVAKGLETDAIRIRVEAGRLGIPVVRDVALARSLVLCDVGEVIPEELYQAAASILKLALEQKESKERIEGDPG